MSETTAADWVDTAQGIASIAQALAILVGGIWAYFKFFRGRTFARRAEVALEASVVSSGVEEFLKVAVNLRNTGASKIVFEERLSVPVETSRETDMNTLIREASGRYVDESGTSRLPRGDL